MATMVERGDGIASQRERTRWAAQRVAQRCRPQSRQESTTDTPRRHRRWCRGGLDVPPGETDAQASATIEHGAAKRGPAAGPVDTAPRRDLAPMRMAPVRTGADAHR